MPIRSIANNMIELDNGEKIAGVKVSPRNIFILEENEEFSIIDGLKDFYNTLDFEYLKSNIMPLLIKQLNI